MVKKSTKNLERHKVAELSEAQLRKALYHMLRSRALDDRLWLLSRQGKVHFVITAAGQEAAQMGMFFAMNVGQDYLVPYYRDMTLAMAMGLSPFEMMCHAMGKVVDPSSGGRQMFGHFSKRDLRIVSPSSSVGSHPIHAVGLALAFRARGETGILTSFGEGATSEGAWHEAMNFAGIHQLPVVFMCQNNQYAISIHQSMEIPVEDVAAKAEGYGMPGVVVDGNDLIEVYTAMLTAMNRARNGEGPTLIEAKTYRFRPHSNADDDSKYRSAEEVEAWRKRDPIKQLRDYMLEHDLITEDELADMQADVDEQINIATREAAAEPPPPESNLYEHLYGEA